MRKRSFFQRLFFASRLLRGEGTYWRHVGRICGLLGLFCLATSLAAARAEDLDFSRDVLPILSDRCFFCHGPDSKRREAGLRLDLQEEAHGWAIVPGRPAESELIRRIFSTDETEIMPPPEAKLELSEEQKKTLESWIEQGAQYGRHWAFEPVERPPLPTLPEAESSVEQAIDLFVQQRLTEKGLSPSAVASRETLIRRLYFDLTGLPPSVEQIRRFVTDEDPNAYEHLVDRLLQSPFFGERMAADWLDVARYADTYGYQNDRYRPMWPWRDWVVEAFNTNLPYDRFITWQLAGDLLPSPTQQQILATAFNRNHRQTNEGGSIEEEFRAEYVADRVNTFGAAFLGLTMECARCHDHKYDPISQRDYYQLAAFFNSIDESGLYSHFTEATPTPTLMLAAEKTLTELAKQRKEIEQLQADLDNWKPAEEDFLKWRRSLSDVRPATPKQAAEEKDLKLSDLLEQSLQACALGHFPLENIHQEQLENRIAENQVGKVQDVPRVVQGKVGKGLLLSGDNNANVPSGGEFTRNQAFSISLWLNAPEHFERAVVFHRSRAWTDSGSRGYELLIENGRLSAALIHFWPGNAIRVRDQQALETGSWVHVAITYDGSSRAEGLSIFVNGRQAEVEVVRDKLTKHIRGADGVGGGESNRLTVGQRFRDRGFKAGRVDELRIFDRELSELELRFLYLQDHAPGNIKEFLYNCSDKMLGQFFLSQQTEFLETQDKLFNLRTAYSEINDQQPEIMVMRELPQPRATYVLQRGAYDSPGERVYRSFPEAFLSPPSIASSDGVEPLPATPPRLDRLDLAEWLVDPQHPLTARVAVNRFWQMLFGQGIVTTSEDFGLQGSQPSHPRLLDWLASEFIASGWDVKRILKTIVMSRTYRQSSDPSPTSLALDPENRYLARGPAVRLPAEMIRDAALAAGGLLATKQGGPPVKPYQPEGLWKEKSGVVYQRDAGIGSHRRSLYTYWKRTSPPPSMMTFDASGREVCTVRRQTTLTPLQMLVILNDPQYVEAAIALAERAMHSSSELDARLKFIFCSVTGRQPSEPELSIIRQLFRDQKSMFRDSPDQADSLLSTGDHVCDPKFDQTDLASLAIVSQAVLAHDEAVMKR